MEDHIHVVIHHDGANENVGGSSIERVPIGDLEEDNISCTIGSQMNPCTCWLHYLSRPCAEGAMVTVSQYYSSHWAWCRLLIPEILKGWKLDPQQVWWKDSSQDNAAGSADIWENVLERRKLTANQVMPQSFIATQCSVLKRSFIAWCDPQRNPSSIDMVCVRLLVQGGLQTH